MNPLRHFIAAIAASFLVCAPAFADPCDNPDKIGCTYNPNANPWGQDAWKKGGSDTESSPTTDESQGQRVPDLSAPPSSGRDRDRDREVELADQILSKLPSRGTCPAGTGLPGQNPGDSYAKTRGACWMGDLNACYALERCQGDADDKGRCRSPFDTSVGSTPQNQLERLQFDQAACVNQRDAVSCMMASSDNSDFHIPQANPHKAYYFMALACNYGDAGSCTILRQDCTPE